MRHFITDMTIQSFKDLRVFTQAFDAAMQIFEHSKLWPTEEKYAMTDQIRRSSRSVCANISEAWRKRRYIKHFVSKLSDADAEAAETRVWLQFALKCSYLKIQEFRTLDSTYHHINGGLVIMMTQPEKWCASKR